MRDGRRVVQDLESEGARDCAKRMCGRDRTMAGEAMVDKTVRGGQVRVWTAGVAGWARLRNSAMETACNGGVAGVREGG